MAITNIFGRDFYQGLDADMATCVPRVDGALFWATDTLVLYCYSGAAWNEVGAGGGGNVATDTIWDAKGDLAAGTGANTASKLTVGTDGKYLKADSGQATGLLWDVLANHDHSGDAGDGGTFDAANLTAGASTDGQVLTSDGAGGAAWEDPAAGSGDVATDAIWDAAGDLAVGTGANTAAKLTKGAAYAILAMPSDASTPTWLATMTDWTPTVTQSAGVNVNITYAKYMRLGNMALVSMWLTCTSAGTTNNTIVVGGIPAAIAPANTGTPCVGIVLIRNAGTAYYTGAVIASSSSTVQFFKDDNTGSYIGASPNFALANADEISFVALWTV